MILETILSVVGCCPLCNLRELQFTNNIPKKKGLANCIEIKCLSTNCHFFYTTYRSNRVSKNKQSGPDPFDLNARSVIAFREIGKRHIAMETFFEYMNCVPPVTYPTYREMNKDMLFQRCYWLYAPIRTGNKRWRWRNDVTLPYHAMERGSRGAILLAMRLSPS